MVTTCSCQLMLTMKLPKPSHIALIAVAGLAHIFKPLLKLRILKHDLRKTENPLDLNLEALTGLLRELQSSYRFI